MVINVKTIQREVLLTNHWPNTCFFQSSVKNIERILTIQWINKICSNIVFCCLNLRDKNLGAVTLKYLLLSNLDNIKCNMIYLLSEITHHQFLSFIYGLIYHPPSYLYATLMDILHYSPGEFQTIVILVSNLSTHHNIQNNIIV